MELSGISDERGGGFKEGDEVCLLLASLEGHGRNFLSAIRRIIFEQSYITLLSFVREWNER